MLKDAATSAKPTKYAQNKRHGMYEGKPSMMDLAPDRCSAPKTANGMAKHKLLKTTIVSRPRAGAISVFAAHSPIGKSRMPAPHIETAVREVSRNVARMVVCMSMPSVARVFYLENVFPLNIASNCIKKSRYFSCEAGWTPDLKHALGCFLVQLFTSRC